MEMARCNIPAERRDAHEDLNNDQESPHGRSGTTGRHVDMDTIERRTMRKVYLRLLPFTFALYLICYLDRTNIGFAALTMNRDLG